MFTIFVNTTAYNHSGKSDAEDNSEHRALPDVYQFGEDNGSSFG